MADFENKIYELKNLIPEEGIGYALEELKLLMPKSASKFNEILLLEGRLKELTRDKRKGILSYEEYKLEYNQISNDVIYFIDGLTVEDFQTKSERKAKKKNQGKLLHRIPNQMELFKRTKCIVRLAFTEEDLLEDIDITEDTVIKSVRIAEVMEVVLRDDNHEKAFEITTPNNKEQFLDEDYYTEWVFYAKPIIPGEHHLTLVVSVLEEVRGKERRRDVVLEEMVTIVTEEPIVDEMFKPSGLVLNTSTNPIPQKTIGQQIRRYAGVFALLILGSTVTWAFTTENGKWELAKLFNTVNSYEKYINEQTKHIETANFDRLEEARWRKAKIIDTEESYTEYLDESILLKYEKEAKERLAELIYQRLFAAQNNAEILKEFIKDFPKNKHINEVIDTLVTVEYEESITTATPENLEPLLTFIQEYQNIERPQNKKLQKKAKEEYERLTGNLFNNKIQPEIEVEPFEIPEVEVEIVEKPTSTTTVEKPEITPEVPTENTTKPTNDTDNVEESTKPKPKKVKNPLEIELISVKGGSFLMGNKNGEDDEKPVRSINVNSFSISKYEITQEQWIALMGKNPSEHKGCKTCPVENVSWNDVQIYLKKLNQKTGKNHRLPTEAEWEFAAKGGTKTKNYKYAGSNNIANVAWYYSGSNNADTQPVGKKAPNELGLYDMTGNVWEWCSDWYDRTYYEKGNSNNPKGPKTGKQKILRGGSLINRAQPCLISNRYYSYPNTKKRHIGFRVVIH